MLPIRTGRSAFCSLPLTLLFALAICTSTGTAIAQQGDDFKAQLSAARDGLPPEVATPAQLQRGRELFMHQWKPGDSATPKGDGLGPMFNAKSCADCHNLGTVGGGGANKSNVDLLSLILPSHMNHADRLTFRERMILFDPSFAVGTSSIRPSITLHKFSTNPAYSEWRRELLVRVAPEPPDLKGLLVKRTPAKSDSSAIRAPSAAYMPKVTLPSRSAEKAAPVQFQLTHRNTPALFGAGLIDSIPGEVIQLAAKHQAEGDIYVGIRGKVALAGSGGVGKFGWRGQIGSLKEFVMGACSNELGLQVPGEDQPIDPLDSKHTSPGLDLKQDQCDDLTAFVANLPAPTRRQPANANDAEQVAAGEHLFNTSGCAICHMERLGNVTGIYSDLLLHDMGSALADPVPANSKLASSEHTAFESRSFSGGYNGGGGGPSGPDVFAAVPPATLREWRTPPLWGVADSAPYLHDGRAATLADAILAHGGEANYVRKNYAALSSRDRAKLLAFLNSLTVAAH